jgi:hypothetical protein
MTMSCEEKCPGSRWLGEGILKGVHTSSPWAVFLSCMGWRGTTGAANVTVKTLVSNAIAGYGTANLTITVNLVQDCGMLSTTIDN